MKRSMTEFVEKAVGDVGALLGGAMVVIGDKLGLYRAMAGAGPLTPAELAGRTGTAERYVREWSSAQAARGYLTYDGAGRFSLPDEHAIPLTDETSPACVIGAFEIAVGSVYATDTIAERFRTGAGFSWGAHDAHVLGGCERFFRPGYLNNLTSAWIPALDGVEAKLTAGARIADVGCGHGASTLLLARGLPGLQRRRLRRPPGLDRRRPQAGRRRRPCRPGPLRGPPPATTFDGHYDLVCFFDCLHDMGDPIGRLRPCPRSPRAGRHAHADRTVRQRRPERQPQPSRRRLLRLLDPALHAELAVSGGGRGAGCAGRRGPAP